MKTRKGNPGVRSSKHTNVSFCILALCIISLIPAAATSTSPIQISLPLPLASGPQPVTIKSGSAVNTNNNDVIGYIVVPYPGSPGSGNDQRADLSALAAHQASPAVSPYFSLLGPSAAAPFAGLGRNYRRLRSSYVPYNPLLYNPLAAYSAFPGYGSLYGYTPRVPFFNLLG